jgi:hypothetical protein
MSGRKLKTLRERRKNMSKFLGTIAEKITQAQIEKAILKQKLYMLKRQLAKQKAQLHLLKVDVNEN